MTEEISGGTCPVKVYRGEWSSLTYAPCGKPAKRNGMCGVHARKADRVEARAVAEAEREAAQQRAAAAAQQLMDLGVAAYPLYAGDRVQLSADEALRLVERLRLAGES